MSVQTAASPMTWKRSVVPAEPGLIFRNLVAPSWGRSRLSPVFRQRLRFNLSLVALRYCDRLASVRLHDLCCEYPNLVFR